MSALIKESSESDIFLISISKSKPDKTFHLLGDEECYYKGKLYDIRLTERFKDKTIYHCINDSKEENLISGLIAFIKSALSGDGSKAEKGSILIKDNFKTFLTEHLFFTLFPKDLIKPVEFYLSQYSFLLHYSLIKPPNYLV